MHVASFVRWKSIAVAVALVLIITACSQGPQLSRIETDGPDGQTIYFLTKSGGGNVNETSLVGELQLNDGCFQIAMDQIHDSQPLNIIWPEGFAVGVGGDAIEIRDEHGRILTQVGQRTLLNGGNGSQSSERHSECEGSFWYAGEEVMAGDEIPAVFD